MNEYPIVIEKTQKDTYADDLVSGGTNLAEVENLKQKQLSFFPKESLIYINGTRIYHCLKMIIQIVNKHTPSNYLVVILVMQKF